jgi:hypothetical protein
MPLECIYLVSTFDLKMNMFKTATVSLLHNFLNFKNPKRRSLVDFLLDQYRFYSTHAFLSCILFIVGVSIYDSYLVVLYQDHILVDERNPICEMLIRKDPNQLSWFLMGKLLGNVGVVGSLLVLLKLKFHHTLTVAKAVAFFQFGLLFYLTFADHATGFLHFDDLFSSDPVRVGQAQFSVLIHVALLSVVGGVFAWLSSLKRNLFRHHSI